MKNQYGGFNVVSAIIILVSLILIFVVVGIIVKIYQNYRKANPKSETTDYGVDQLKAMNSTTLNCPDYWSVINYNDKNVTCQKINDSNIGDISGNTITLPTLTTEKWGDILSTGIKKGFNNILKNKEVKERCDKVVNKGVIWQGFSVFC